MNISTLLGLLQLASPTLPIGAYSYSQGLESAIECSYVNNELTGCQWIQAHLYEVVAKFDAPVFCRLCHAFAAQDIPLIVEWTARVIASRDTSEFRAETIQMGYSLNKLLIDVGVTNQFHQDVMSMVKDIPLLTALACASNALSIPAEVALAGMLYSMAENMVLVCVKSVPLGQAAGQRILLKLSNDIVVITQQAQECVDEHLSNWCPGLSLLSMQHEQQYSRLYRS